MDESWLDSLQVQRIFSPLKHPDRPVGSTQPHSYSTGIGGFLTGVKRSWREVDDSPLSSAEVTSDWNYTSTPHMRLWSAQRQHYLYVFRNVFGTGSSLYTALPACDVRSIITRREIVWSQSLASPKHCHEGGETVRIVNLRCIKVTFILAVTWSHWTLWCNGQHFGNAGFKCWSGRLLFRPRFFMVFVVSSMWMPE
jgi:hypothetical protein